MKSRVRAPFPPALSCVPTPVTDAGSTTIRVILVSVVFDIVSYWWKVMAALSLSYESTFEYWDARLFFPLSEGLKVLPTAIVVSVWMDVANSTMSRSKVNKLG